MRIAGLKPACLLLTSLAIAACVGEHSPMTAESVEWGYDGPGAPATLPGGRAGVIGCLSYLASAAKSP